MVVTDDNAKEFGQRGQGGIKEIITHSVVK